MSSQNNSVGGINSASSPTGITGGVGATSSMMPNSGQGSPNAGLGNLTSNGPGGAGMPGSAASGNYTFTMPQMNIPNSGASGPGSIQSPMGGPAGSGGSLGGVDLNSIKAVVGAPMNAQGNQPVRGNGGGPRMKTQAEQFVLPVISSDLAGQTGGPGVGMLQLLQKYRAGQQ